MRRLLLSTTAISVALFLSNPASAQAPAQNTSKQTTAAQSSDQLEVVVVTAERKATNIEKTPISMVALQGSELNALGRVSMDDVLKNVPGVVVQGQAKGFTPAIRGLGSDLPPGSGEGAVATNFDGVYDIRAEGAVLGYYDLSRVEVLRGPQGTLYGRNATAGVVNVISNDPTQKFEAGGTVEYGNYNLLRGEGMVNLPLSDTLAVRAAFVSMNRDGFLSNGEDDNVGSAARVKVLYQPSDTFSLLVGGEYTKLGGKGAGAVPEFISPPGKPYTATDPSQDYNHFNGYKTWAQLKWDMGFGVLTVLPAYQHANDEEYGFFGGHGNAGSDPEKLEQKSGEIRLNSEPGSKVTWVAGAYHYDYDELVNGYQLSYASGVYTLGPALTYTTYHADSDALFGEISYPIIDSVRVKLGGRETWDWKTTTTNNFGPVVGGQVTSTHFDYKIGLDADLTPNTFGYATVTTGYRPGGNNPTDGSPFKPEKVTSYEIGVKSQLLDRRLQINADVYYYDYRDYQASDFYIGPTGPLMVFSNVAKVENYGGEVEATALVTPNDLLTASVAYLSAHFRAPVYFHTNPFAPGINEDGAVLPHSPGWTLVGSYQHIFDLGDSGIVQPRVDLRYTSQQYVNPIETAYSRQPAYWSEEMALTYTPDSGNWSITGYVKNLSDEVVKTADFVGFMTLAAPRTYGVTLTAKIGG